ncbi:MAG TPA: bifunctional glutamate N-acetyltransferase/amino-acid acetyltransferase ArgJ [Burkholderiaceae bacterium]|nr:bifunctional glutamate N-acetyltransferase/amino-acid acetyltransferase ArgJ [Burkholderiaceae bacterium]
MAVGLHAPVASNLRPVAGCELGWAQAGIRKAGRKDLLLIRLAERASVAGVFTRNRFCAAPVQVCRAHLGRGLPIRALLINSGCANAGTGASGLADALHTCDAVARLLGCEPAQVLPFSTGVIMEPLPVQTIVDALPQAVARFASSAWLEAAEAIMTTDTVPKAASRRCELDGAAVNATGIAKGAGMIRPDMATLLAFVVTDAAVAPAVLAEMTRRVADASFNRITVDGDMSTNDSFVVAATGQGAGPAITNGSDPRCVLLESAITDLAHELALAIVRDGEGASKFIRVSVEGACSEREASTVAYAVAHSPLVKTAMFASDPNLGRILSAVGASGIEDLDPSAVQLYLNDVWVARNGARHPDYREEVGQKAMGGAEILVRIVLGRGGCAASVWTCDLSHGYVSINADYRS